MSCSDRVWSRDCCCFGVFRVGRVWWEFWVSYFARLVQVLGLVGGGVISVFPVFEQCDVVMLAMR